MVWVALDCGSVVVEGRLVGLASQGLPVPSVAGFTSSCGTSVLSSLGADVIWFTTDLPGPLTWWTKKDHHVQ